MIEPNRDGDVWVFAEQQDGKIHDVVLELCGKARELADRLGVKAGCVLAGATLTMFVGDDLLITDGYIGELRADSSRDHTGNEEHMELLKKAYN